MNFDLGCATTRMPELKDVEEIYRYRNDDDVYVSLGGVFHGMSRENVKEWINFHNHNEKDHVWVIVDKVSDKCVGHLGLYQIDFRNGKAEIGIAIAKEYWGKGIGKLAYKEILNYAFNQLNLNRVETFNLASNKKIIHIKQKFGFQIEGIMRQVLFKNGQYQDKMIMAILKSEYIALQNLNSQNSK